MTKNQKMIKGILTVACLIILALLWFVFMPGQEDEPDYGVPSGTAEFHFIDVGQGDAILIKVGDKNVLVDTGDYDAKEALFEYLDTHGVSEIEYFVVTHYDSDHFANATAVLDKYDVKKVLVPDQVKDTKTYEKFIAKLEEQVESKDIEVLNANEMIGSAINVDDLELKVLAPLKNNYKDSNDYSVCLMARYGNKRVLLTGDAEKTAEADIAERYSEAELNCDVYKMGHHGSRTSSSQALLDMMTPESVVISCGVGNEYKHPHKEALDRVEGLKVYRTDTQGTIVLSIANDTLSFKTEK